MKEQVLVIENRLLTTHITLANNCLITDIDEPSINKIIKDHTFMPRDEAEYNFDHKQVIPYVIIRDDRNYLLLKRTKKQAEKRLHDKYSLGIGGHINPAATEGEDNVVKNNLYRELNEEIMLNDPADLNFIGIINDESNSVSRVHLGLLYVLAVNSPGYQVLETDKMTAQWMSQDKLMEFYPDLETWSQVVCDHYIFSKKLVEKSVTVNDAIQ